MVVGWTGSPPTLCLSTVSSALKECEAASTADVTVTVVIGFLSNLCHLQRETLKHALCFLFSAFFYFHRWQNFSAVVFPDECSQSELPLQCAMQNRAKTERQTVNKFHFLSACIELNIIANQRCPSKLSLVKCSDSGQLFNGSVLPLRMCQLSGHSNPPAATSWLLQPNTISYVCIVTTEYKNYGNDLTSYYNRD